MNLSDLLYPNNPKRRQEVIDLHQKLLDCLRLNFKATEELIETLNVHLGAGIAHVAMKEDGTIKENCDIIIRVLNEIQQEVWKLDRDMKEKLEPGMYRKLYDIKQPELGKIAAAHSIVSTVLGEATATAGIVAVKLICSNVVTVTVSKLIALLAQIGVSVLGGIGIGVLGLGMDIILHAILGAVERETLLASIQSYEQHLAEFEEASEAYQCAVAEVSVLVKEKVEFGDAPPHQ
ncbi:single-pass membrane and coiled-coil domain-containing protein 3 [Tiliqua scincoides]|uniref:single-pass membrane and coiled-coil domain-containing protein 3 n=1 Tax=Tiliqua scincoides TaxID=71010 RepID=UPI0034621254